MNRRIFNKLLSTVPIVNFSKDHTLYQLISSKNGTIRITSYDRTLNFFSFDSYELDKIEPKWRDRIEKDIIAKIESDDWIYHNIELQRYESRTDAFMVYIDRIKLYKDSFGTYRYRIIKTNK